MISRAAGGVTSHAVSDEHTLTPPVATATTDDVSHEMTPTSIQGLNE